VCSPESIYIIVSVYGDGFKCCPLTENNIVFDKFIKINNELLELINFTKV
jgi:hypothetical protein